MWLWNPLSDGRHECCSYELLGEKQLTSSAYVQRSKNNPFQNSQSEWNLPVQSIVAIVGAVSFTPQIISLVCIKKILGAIDSRWILVISQFRAYHCCRCHCIHHCQRYRVIEIRVRWLHIQLFRALIIQVFWAIWLLCSNYYFSSQPPSYSPSFRSHSVHCCWRPAEHSASPAIWSPFPHRFSLRSIRYWKYCPWLGECQVLQTTHIYCK